MTTKNLSKTFKGKINGQRLPPIPITDEQPLPIATNTNLPNSILKKSNPLTENRMKENLDDDDDEPDTSRTIFQKSQTDVLLLLDTYPPKTWSIPKCLKNSHENTTDQSRTLNPIFDTLLSSVHQHGDFIDTFPSPLSDRLPSSRYCRRSVSSSCSRRSSILFHRQTGIPVDPAAFRREDSFETVCESIPETVRSSYPPLPPIRTDLTKSLEIANTDPLPISTDPEAVDLTKSLVLPPTNLLPSISPPLITSEESLAIQKKKEEFTQQILSKSLHRESSNLTTDKAVNPLTIVHKPAVMKPVVVPRTQKSAVVDPRRVSSVERHPAPQAPLRTKLPTSGSTTCLSTNNHPRLGKMSLDIFQPLSKSNTSALATTKKPTITTNKTKISMKVNVPKVKISPVIPDEEPTPSNNDVIPAPSSPSQPSPVSTSIETSQVTNIAKSEDLPSPVANAESATLETDQSKSLAPVEFKCQPSSRASARYSHRRSHPVPEPLTLQGEKTLDPEFLQTIVRTPAYQVACQRSVNMKGQPVIVNLFEDPVVETQKSTVKFEPTPPTKPLGVKMRKCRPNFGKCAKPKKPVILNKLKPSTPVIEKVEMKCQGTSTEIFPDDEKVEENMIVIGGTDWMLSVKPQASTGEESALSHSFDIPPVDDDDLPSCISPTDQLEVSQSTLMTSVGDLQRRDSIGSEQAIEISPVLAQIVEHPVEIPPESSLQPHKSDESPLLNSDIRTVYETVRDSIRKDTSLRSLPLQSNEQEVSLVKPSLTPSNSSTQTKTLPFEATTSASHTYNNSDTGLSIRPALRVVTDSLNSRGSETVGSTSSQEDFSTIPLCTENDCDEIYRTARKGRQAGRGAYGIVWSCLTSTGRMIAVKEIELDEGDSERVRDDYASVREEIHILRALTHPYVVKFLGISLENTRLVKIFMEYLPNGTIENLLTSFGPFHNDVLKKYTRQIVEGVSYLHDNNVVHRDIKGKNIMLDAEGNIKLIDFGCAKLLKKNQNTHSMRQLLKSMKGTANWMAPEVIAETGHGKKADIWSIGCTLCEMATGKPPWSSERNHLAVLLIIANGTKPPADLPDTCSVSAQEFFRICLTRDPVARPSSRDLLSHPFLSS